jgi:hypothetical protein
VTSNQNNQQTENIVDRRFDEPLYVAGQITNEPERYLAEKPYELSKFEFSVIKKGKFKSEAWFQLVCGATAGFVIAILGKTLNALIQKQTPSLENWELWSVVAGVVLAIILKNRSKTPDEKEFDEIKEYISQHFEGTRPRRIHVPGREEGQE